ncbi:MAG: CHASE3 domain-containing protein [Bacteroidia bacterium]
MKKISPFTLSKIVFSATLIIMFTLAFLSYKRVDQLSDYSSKVDNTNAFKYNLEQCISLLKDAETGQRGYFLTADSAFLNPVNIANDRLKTALADLKKNGLVNNENMKEIERFEQAALVKLDHTNYQVAHYSKTEDYKKSRVAILQQGKLLMDYARFTAAKIRRNTDRNLKSAIEKENDFSSVTPLFIVFTSLFSIVMIVFAYYVVVKELQKRILIQNDLDYNIEALKRSNSELEQFAYVASHDLQEPLRKIQSFGNRLVLKQKYSLDDDAKFIIERMQSSAQRMQSLINDLLSYSRISNVMKKKFALINLNTIVKNVMDVLHEEIQDKKAVVTIDKLPGISASASQMEQLFQNLLTNALKFMPDGRKPVIQIKYSLTTGKEIPNMKPTEELKMFHKVSVSDNGIGFEEQYSERIFIIFQRLEGRSQYTGSGIGLAICKKIIANHNGYIIAQSKLNEGSTFIIYLSQH